MGLANNLCNRLRITDLTESYLSLALLVVPYQTVLSDLGKLKNHTFIASASSHMHISVLSGMTQRHWI